MGEARRRRGERRERGDVYSHTVLTKYPWKKNNETHIISNLPCIEQHTALKKEHGRLSAFCHPKRQAREEEFRKWTGKERCITRAGFSFTLGRLGNRYWNVLTPGSFWHFLHFTKWKLAFMREKRFVNLQSNETIKAMALETNKNNELDSYRRICSMQFETV